MPTRKKAATHKTESRGRKGLGISLRSVGKMIAKEDAANLSCLEHSEESKTGGSEGKFPQSREYGQGAECKRFNPLRTAHKIAACPKRRVFNVSGEAQGSQHQNPVPIEIDLVPCEPMTGRLW
jgi:hypothetical protein